MQAEIFKCNGCGAELIVHKGEPRVTCGFCGSVVTVPDELYNRLNEELFQDQKEEIRQLQSQIQTLDQEKEVKEKGKKIYDQARKVWSFSIVLVVLLTIVFYMIYLRSDHLFFSGLAPFTVMFGSTMILMNRPSKIKYERFYNMRNLEAFALYANVWRIGVFLWCTIETILWSLSEVPEYSESAVDAACPILLIGIIVFAAFRPYRYFEKRGRL